MKYYTVFSLVVMMAMTSLLGAAKGKDLFILSGQSNMYRLDPEISFIPALEKALGKDNFITVKSAKGGQPIIMWIKKENDATNHKDAGILYTPLASAIETAIKGEKIKSVTFLWMQGEKDSRNDDGNNITLYKQRFLTLLKQLEADFGFSNINVVIGRLSDAAGEKNTNWFGIRKIQEELAETLPSARIVNTDDLNDGLQLYKEKERQVKNDIHYTIEGYKIFGDRLAEAALEMVR